MCVSVCISVFLCIHAYKCALCVPMYISVFLCVCVYVFVSVCISVFLCVFKGSLLQAPAGVCL